MPEGPLLRSQFGMYLLGGFGGGVSGGLRVDDDGLGSVGGRLSWARARTGPTRSCRASRPALRLLSHSNNLPRQGEEQKGQQGTSAPPSNQRTMTGSSSSKPVVSTQATQATPAVGGAMDEAETSAMGVAQPSNACPLTSFTAPTSRGWGSVGESSPAERRVNSPTDSASRPAVAMPHTPPRVTFPSYSRGPST